MKSKERIMYDDDIEMFYGFLGMKFIGFQEVLDLGV